MCAVLEDAIRCLKGEVGPGALRCVLAAEARAWVQDEDQRWLFSFENICLALEVDPARLRARLLANFPEVAPPPPPRRRDPRSEDVAVATRMIRAGHSLGDVARTLGISVPRVSTLSRGLASRLRARRDADIRRLRAEGWTCGALAAHYGLSRIRVYRICERRGAADEARADAPRGDAAPEEAVSC